MKINITRDGIVECYGNRAGYIKEKTAIVDAMFKRDEVEQYLLQENGFAVIWKDGVFDNLLQGKIEDCFMLKFCRIYQLKPEVDLRMKYISYKELKSKGFGEPNITNYRVVFDGNIGTNNLEEIFAKLNQLPFPDGYDGYAMSKSDIIELYDDSGSDFYYADSIGFIKLDVHTIEKNREIKKWEIPTTENETVSPKTGKSILQAEASAEEEFQVETFKISM